MSNHYCHAYNGRVILNGSFLPFWLKNAPQNETIPTKRKSKEVPKMGAIFNQKGKNEPFLFVFLLYVKRNNNISNHYCCIKSNRRSCAFIVNKTNKTNLDPHFEVALLFYFFRNNIILGV